MFGDEKQKQEDKGYGSLPPAKFQADAFHQQALMAKTLARAIIELEREVATISPQLGQRLRIAYFLQYLLITNMLSENVVLPARIRDFTGKSIRTALSTGIPKYNEGNHKACLEAYRHASAVILNPQHAHDCNRLCVLEKCEHEIHPLLTPLQNAVDMADSDASLSVDSKAWVLRRAFDFLLVNRLI